MSILTHITRRRSHLEIVAVAAEVDDLIVLAVAVGVMTPLQQPSPVDSAAGVTIVPAAWIVA